MNKVLVVDDDLGSRKILGKIIEEMGYVAILASSGSRALQVLADNSDIAVLITDFMMPDMDGKALVRAVKGDQSLRRVRIMMISGFINLDEISGLLELGVERFSSKPIKVAEVKDYLATFIAEVSL